MLLKIVLGIFYMNHDRFFRIKILFSDDDKHHSKGTLPSLSLHACCFFLSLIFILVIGIILYPAHSLYNLINFMFNFFSSIIEMISCSTTISISASMTQTCPPPRPHKNCIRFRLCFQVWDKYVFILFLFNH